MWWGEVGTRIIFCLFNILIDGYFWIGVGELYMGMFVSFVCSPYFQYLRFLLIPFSFFFFHSLSLFFFLREEMEVSLAVGYCLD